MTLALHDFSPDSIAYEPDSSDRERSRSRRDALARYDILDSASETQFDDLVTLAARIVGTQAAAISLIDDHRQWFKARCGIEPSETPLSVSFCAHAIESDDLFVIRDASSDCRFADNPLVTGPPHVRFYAGMRILAGDGTPIAALCVIDQTPRPDGLTAIEETTLRTLAGQVEALLELRRLLLEREAQVIAQSRLSDRLRYVAEHDDLTGLPRRDLFQRRLIAAMHDAAQNGTRTAMLFVDVDHFKSVNDRYGHLSGDDILRQVAHTIQKSIRGSDACFRYGGEEFLICVTNSNPGLARAVAERIRMAISDTVRLPDRAKPVTASFGIAHYNNESDWPELVARADKALFAAKQQGRNRVVTSLDHSSISADL